MPAPTAMAALPALVPRYTVADLAAWEDRWELIEGIPHAMSPAPSFRHQIISGEIFALLREALGDCPACWAVAAANWRISDETVVIPDLLVGCGPMPEGVYLDTPPVLVVEILSPSTALKDRTVKHALYAQEGVRHYVLVDPARETLEAFALDRGEYAPGFQGQEGEALFSLGPRQVRLDVGRLWG